MRHLLKSSFPCIGDIATAEDPDGVILVIDSVTVSRWGGWSKSDLRNPRIFYSIFIFFRGAPPGRWGLKSPGHIAY